MLRLRASGADRWANCLGSLLSKEVRSSSVFSNEGTQAHDLAAAVLQGADFDLDDGISKYVDECVSEAKLRPHTLVENYSEIIIVNPYNKAKYRISGTSDFLCYSEDQGVITGITIIDFKFGQWVAVNADTLQLMIYAMLFVMTTLKNRKIRATCPVTLRIIQPRSKHGKTASSKTISVQEVLLFHQKLINKLNKQLFLLNKLNEVNYSDGEWCKWCPNLINCSLKQSQAEHALKCAL